MKVAKQLEVRIDKAEYWDEPRDENVKIGTLAAHLRD